jgi:hypothetical protein
MMSGALAGLVILVIGDSHMSGLSATLNNSLVTEGRRGQQLQPVRDERRRLGL